jgi:hypothetical protein
MGTCPFRNAPGRRNDRSAGRESIYDAVEKILPGRKLGGRLISRVTAGKSEPWDRSPATEKKRILAKVVLISAQ